MSLPHVLLGLLSERASTGYDLARTLEVELAPVWRAEISQIYPALARLRRAGFVLLRVLGPRRAPRRNLSRITAAGRRELRRWVAEPPPPPRSRDDGMARMAFLDALPLEERRRALHQYERSLTEEIRRLRGGPELPLFRGEARRATIERVEATRRWARALLQSSASSTAAAVRSSEKKR